MELAGCEKKGIHTHPSKCNFSPSIPLRPPRDVENATKVTGGSNNRWMDNCWQFGTDSGRY